MLISTKTIKVFPNNKTWISKSIKSTLNEKNIAFQTGDRAERKRVQAKLTRELREGKREYKAKVEKQFQTGNMADAWDGLKTLTGEKKNMCRGSHMTAEEQVKSSNELNDFYCRFERDDLGEDINSVVLELKEKISECEEGKDFEINASVVESLFTKLNVKKAAGPDSISGKLLKVSASQLCSVFANLFNWSLTECCVPSVWKKLCYLSNPQEKEPILIK